MSGRGFGFPSTALLYREEELLHSGTFGMGGNMDGFSGFLVDVAVRFVMDGPNTRGRQVSPNFEWVTFGGFQLPTLVAMSGSDHRSFYFR